MTQTLNQDATPIAVRDELAKIRSAVEALIARLDRVEALEEDTAAAARSTGVPSSHAGRATNQIADDTATAAGYLRHSIKALTEGVDHAKRLADVCYEASQGRQ